jgi:DivIVA domain-containing protein
MRLLTPKDIHEKKFSVHRFREGYDIDEVDDFMEEVEETARKLGSIGLGLLSLLHGRKRNDSFKTSEV